MSSRLQMTNKLEPCFAIGKGREAIRDGLRRNNAATLVAWLALRQIGKTALAIAQDVEREIREEAKLVARQ